MLYIVMRYIVSLPALCTFNMRALFSLFFWILSFPVFAQQLLSVQNISDGGGFDFPLIKATNTNVQDKINIHLHLSELDILPSPTKKNVFSVVSSMENGGLYGGKTHIQYKVLANNNRLLSIRLDQESSCLTTAYWSRYYNFNPHTGDRYSLQDFCSKENFVLLQKTIAFERKKEINRLLNDLVVNKIDTPDFSSLVSAIDEDDDLSDFFISSDTLYIDMLNLFHKNDRGYDVEYVTAISLDKFRYLLNDFGEAVFVSGEGLARYHALTHPQLFKGYIEGKYPFYMLIRHTYSNKYAGTYAYTKYGAAINLDGEKDGDEFVFTERSYEEGERPKFKFRLENRTMKGTYVNNKGRVLDFTALKE